MISIGFTRSQYDGCVYIKWKDGVAATYLLLYVDDMLVASKDKAEISLLKQDLQSKFEMKDLGDAKRILGMDIRRDRRQGKLWLIQHDYIYKVLKKFNMHEAREVVVPLAQHFRLSVEQRPRTDKE